MSVPGHDGKEGFGGACLPKDTNALYKYAESKGIHLSLIEKVLKLSLEVNFVPVQVRLWAPLKYFKQSL